MPSRYLWLGGLCGILALATSACLDEATIPCGALLCPADQRCVDDVACVDAALFELCAAPARAGDACRYGPLTGICVADMCELAVCGDGARQTIEQCDDANIVNGDGCNGVCAVEACGNGVVDAGEACDCGAAGMPGDPAVCGDGVNGGTVCQPTCTLPACGDDVLDPGEACDDGNRADGDGCSRSCDSNEACGNGVRDVGEECDDGNLDDHDGCQHGCVVQRCGDGIVDPGAGEGCDDGDLDSNDACLASCVNATCGDGILFVGVEACDDGNGSDQDGCVGSCVLAVCGDGLVIDGVEECDDGNDTNADGCLNSCDRNSCGDGIVYVGHEECDDGERINGDGCDDHCRVECSIGPCFLVLEGARTWDEAQADCLHIPGGAGLAIINSPGDNVRVSTQLGGQPGWIGIDKASANVWWNLQPIAYDAWAPGEPGGAEHVIATPDGWLTRDSGDSYVPVCMVN